VRLLQARFCLLFVLQPYEMWNQHFGHRAIRGRLLLQLDHHPLAEVAHRRTLPVHRHQREGVQQRLGVRGDLTAEGVGAKALRIGCLPSKARLEPPAPIDGSNG